MMMRIAKIGWVIVVTVMLVMYVAGMIVYYNQLRQVCTMAVEVCRQSDLPTLVGREQIVASGMSLEMFALLRVGFRVLFALVPLALGLLIFARRRDEPFALFISFFLVVLSQWGGDLFTALEQAFPTLEGTTKLLLFLGSIMLPLFFGLFPNGRMVPRVYWVVVIFFGTMSFVNGILGIGDPLTDPFWNVISYVGWLSVLLGGAAAQVYRYLRVSDPVEKRQTKWVLFGVALLAVWIVGLLALAAIVGDPTMGTNRDPYILRHFGFTVLLGIGFSFIPLSIGLAVLRSRLFDIDVIIRRTVTYALVGALLAIVYFGNVILLQQIFAGITGQRSEPITILSTLAIAALFVPLRNRIQDAIDKRFNRKKYDAQKVLQKFGETVRDETDLDKLTAELINVVQETMQPRSVSVWLRKTDDGRRTVEGGMKDEG